MTTRKLTFILTAHSNMRSKLLIPFFSLFLFCSPVLSQKQVTIDRTKLAQDRNRKKTASRQTEARKREVAKAKSKKTTTRRMRRMECPQVASYLRIDNAYSDNVSKNIWYSSWYGTFNVKTDGKVWDVLMLPSWCKVTSRTSSSFTLAITENNSYDMRKDWFVVRSDSKRVKVNITQDGKPINVSASVNNVRVTHNLMVGGKKTMLVSGSFDVVNAQGLSFRAVAMIKDESGKYARGYLGNSWYRMKDGNFCAMSETFTNSSHTNTHSFNIAIPNDSFNPGYNKKNNLTLVVALYCIKKEDFVSGSFYSTPFVAKKKKKGVVTK